MKILLAIILLASAVYFGNDFYADYQNKLQAPQQALIKMEQEQKILDATVSQKDITALNLFIQQNPQSVLIEKAIYERNRLAYKQAIASNNPKQIRNFINNYPKSQLVDSAQQHLLRLQQVLTQELIADETTKSQPDRALKQPYQKKSREKLSQQSLYVQKKSAPDKPAPDSSDRVTRALAIYQKMRKKEQQADQQKRAAQQHREADQTRCFEIRDQLKQFKRNTRWFELDDKGNRVFIEKDQVAQRQNKMQSFYDQNCK